MKRKSFLASLITIPAAVKALGNQVPPSCQDETKIIIPPYLRHGDIIGITASAGYISLEEIQPAIDKLTEWGFKVRVGKTLGKRDFTFSGTDEERLADLQEMIDNKDIRAVLFARGGYGLVRIVDRLDLKGLRSSPKWLIGFSDITVMHSHIHANAGVATIHSKMCNSFPSDWSLADEVQKFSIESIRMCLDGSTIAYSVPPDSKNRNGIGTGQLVGGNMKTIESLAGSRSDIRTDNKILFVEDTGEYLYSLDRIFWNLKRSGKLEKLSGLIIGGFRIKPDDEGDEFGMNLEQIILEKVKGLPYPVCFGFPVGHQRNNYALKCGVVHTLTVTSTGCRLSE